MTLTIELTPEQEARLNQAAEEQGVPVTEVVRDLVNTLPEAVEADRRRRLAAIALLQSWRDAEDEEADQQCRSWAALEEKLNANALSNRRRI